MRSVVQGTCAMFHLPYSATFVFVFIVLLLDFLALTTYAQLQNYQTPDRPVHSYFPASDNPKSNPLAIFQNNIQHPHSANNQPSISANDINLLDQKSKIQKKNEAGDEISLANRITTISVPKRKNDSSKFIPYSKADGSLYLSRIMKFLPTGIDRRKRLPNLRHSTLRSPEWIDGKRFSTGSHRKFISQEDYDRRVGKHEIPKSANLFNSNKIARLQYYGNNPLYRSHKKLKPDNLKSNNLTESLFSRPVDQLKSSTNATRSLTQSTRTNSTKGNSRDDPFHFYPSKAKKFSSPEDSFPATNNVNNTLNTLNKSSNLLHDDRKNAKYLQNSVRPAKVLGFISRYNNAFHDAASLEKSSNHDKGVSFYFQSFNLLDLKRLMFSVSSTFKIFFDES